MTKVTITTIVHINCKWANRHIYNETAEENANKYSPGTTCNGYLVAWCLACEVSGNGFLAEHSIKSE